MDRSIPSPAPVIFVSLTVDELAKIIEQAVARGAVTALAQQQEAYLPPPEACAYIYGKPGMLSAFNKLRSRYPEIDENSVGTGRFRRWRRSSLDQFLATKPNAIRRQAEQAA